MALEVASRISIIYNFPFSTQVQPYKSHGLRNLHFKSFFLYKSWIVNLESARKSETEDESVKL